MSSAMTARARRAVIAAVAMTTAVATLLPGGAASAAPPGRADLVAGLAADPAEVPPDGGTVALAVSVRNAGTAPAVDPAVRIALPRNATLSAADLPGGWTCDTAARRCRYGTLAAGAAAPTLELRVTLPAATAGGRATVTATVTTRTRESSTANNTAAAPVRYVAARPDLTFEFRPESTEVSHLGGMGARAFVQAVTTNVGTAAAPDVTFRFTPPAGARTDPAENEPFGWRCDDSAPVWVCTGPAGVAAGQSEYLNLSVFLPAGTPGETVTMAGAVATTATERSPGNNTGETSFRYVVPRPADIVVQSVSVVPHDGVRAGEPFDVLVELDNAGGSPAEGVRVRVPLPPTVRVTSLDPGVAGWTCALAEAAVECARAGAYDISRPYELLRLPMTAGPGAPAGPLTFTATASTTGPEESTGNNTAEGATVYVAEGRMTGTAWIDSDRDGRRDAGEPSAYGIIGKIEFVLEGTEPEWDVPRTTVDDDGTYAARLAPGRYVAQVYLQPGTPYDFTTPDVGDDAGDSDVIAGTGGTGNRGWSAVVEVPDGGAAVVDVGLVPAG